MGLFGKSSDKHPKDLVNEWSHKLRKEGYQLDRQIRGIQREEEKIKKSLKEAAKKGDKDVCVILAKEVIKARKAINKIHTTKAHLNSVQLQMKNQLATVRVAGSLQKSTEVMTAMQNIIRLSEVSDTMRELSKEMMKAGIIEEMLEETFDNMEDTEEMEEEAQEQVDRILWEETNGMMGKAPVVSSTTPGVSIESPDVLNLPGPSREQKHVILWELTAGTLGKAPAAVTDTLPPTATEIAGPSYEEDQEELEEMQSRLEALRS